MSQSAQGADWLAIARATLKAEVQALKSASERLDNNLAKAVEIIINHPGKIIVSGVGKSSHVGRKLAATLCSTGTPAVFLHASEAIHGDLGVYAPGDPTILVSKSGATAEIVRLIPILREFNSPLIAIVGNPDSQLAIEADAFLDAHVVMEADPLGIVPTASTLVALALGDALASALVAARQFTEVDFVRYHPGGQLGRNLSLRVIDVMHKIDQVPCVRLETSIREVVIAMSERPLGAACVVDADMRLLGLITDGDIRRAFQQFEDIRLLDAEQIMTAHPVSIDPEASLKEAAHRMEDRPSQISVLPVLAKDSARCLGLIRLHDVYQAELT